MSLPFKFTAEEVISEGRTTKANVENIKTWLKNNSETFIPKVLPDELIVQFLLSCVNDVEFTKKTIISHFKMKREAPELHDNRDADAEDMKGLFDIWSISTFPIRTKENYAVHYFRLNDPDYKKFDVTAVLRSTLMLMDVTLEKNPPDGFIAIIDLKPAGLLHLTKCKFDIIKKYFVFVQEGMSMQLKAIHMMNSSFVVHKCFNIIRTLIKNDVFDRIHFYPTNVKWETFHEKVPKEYLAKEYGGDLDPLDEVSLVTHDQFRDRQKYWELEEKLRKSCK